MRLILQLQARGRQSCKMRITGLLVLPPHNNQSYIISHMYANTHNNHSYNHDEKSTILLAQKYYCYSVSNIITSTLSHVM